MPSVITITSVTPTPGTPSTLGTLVDHSGTIASGNATQTVCAANGWRKYFLFQNISDTDMWINFDTAATTDEPSILIVKNGGSLVFENGYCPPGPVSVICTAGSKKFVAKEV